MKIDKIGTMFDSPGFLNQIEIIKEREKLKAKTL
jgi:hypothetical protein